MLIIMMITMTIIMVILIIIIINDNGGGCFARFADAIARRKKGIAVITISKISELRKASSSYRPSAR